MGKGQGKEGEEKGRGREGIGGGGKCKTLSPSLKRKGTDSPGQRHLGDFWIH